MMKTNKTTLAVLIASCFGHGLAMADETQDFTKILSPVVVTATRTEQDSFDLPMSIDKVEKKDIQGGQPRVSLAEALVRVPGVTAQYRNQNSSDLQISSRGFGARSTFGVRGVRLYVDGIPLTMPDGIGTPGNVDLGSIGGIEVMRGPFSAMYGNSSGGVIQLFTDTPPSSPQIGVDYYNGSFSTTRSAVEAAGTQGTMNYLLSTSDSSSTGFRKQSAWDKQQATARIGTTISEDTKLVTLVNWFQQNAQDPGGLRRTGGSANNPSAFPGQAGYNWTGATAGALGYNAHGEKSNLQIGFNLEKTIDGNNKLNVITYAGNRTSDGYISAPYTSGGSTNYKTGRLSQIDRDFYGIDLQGTNRGQFDGKPYVLTYGVTAGFQRDLRKDSNQIYDAATGLYQMVSPVDFSVVANPAYKRNDVQKASNFDQYVQGTYSFAEKWDLHAGVRHSSISMSLKDRAGTFNKTLDFNKTIPVAGLVFKAAPTLNFYANVGRGFEAPNLIEVSYNDSTSPTGPNTNIKPSSSTNYEVGSKWMASDNTRINTAIFNITTKDEIVIASSGDYTVYGNAGHTRRSGAELSVEHALSSSFNLYAAYTLLDAKYGNDVTIKNNSVAGKQIPGTYKTQLYAEAAYKYLPAGFSTALEARYNSKVYATDDNGEAAPSYTIVNFRASLQQVTGKWRITEYARIENLLDVRYIGSIKVNDTNTRYYESSPGRNWIVGVKANYAF